MTAKPVPAFTPAIQARFWTYVDVDPDGCWLWTGWLKSGGYGGWCAGGLKFSAHRVAYEWTVGPIPEGLDLDHLCRVRNCVNPAHLEPVTRQENLLRGSRSGKTHCPQGHPYTEDNIYRDAGGRKCRICVKARVRRWKLQQKRGAA